MIDPIKIDWEAPNPTGLQPINRFFLDNIQNWIDNPPPRNKCVYCQEFALEIKFEYVNKHGQRWNLILPICLACQKLLLKTKPSD